MSRTPRLIAPALGVAAAAVALAAAASPAQAVTLCIDPPPGPSPVDTIRLQTVGPTSITAGYQLPFGCYDLPTQLRVLVNGVPRDPFAGGVSGSLTVDGLEPATAYGLVFQYRNGDTWEQFGALKALTSPAGLPTPTVAPTPGPTPEPTPDPADSRAFATRGSTVLRTAGLSGTFRLAGSLSAQVPSSGSGQVSGTLSGATSSGTFLVGGLVPAKTSVTLTGGAIVGALDAGKLTASATTSVAIGRTTVLGVVLNASTSCATVKPVPLSLSGPFNGSTGRLTGTFTLPAFSGCGTLGRFLGTTSARSAINLELLPGLGLPPTPAPLPAS